MTASVEASRPERAFVRGGVDAERESRHDRQAGGRERLRELARVRLALRRRVAAADDRERRPVQQRATPDEEQHRRRVADVEQRARIVGVVPRDDVMRRIVEPARRCVERVLRDRCERGCATAGGTWRASCATDAPRIAAGSSNARSSVTSARCGSALCASVAHASDAGRAPSASRARAATRYANRPRCGGEAGRASSGRLARSGVRQRYGVRT